MLALFDLDNTLIDRLGAFKQWAAEFAEEHDVDPEWLIDLDADGSMPMRRFFAHVKEGAALPESAEELWAAFRQRMPRLVTCRPEVLDGLSALRAEGWTVGIVTNGMTDNQTAKIMNTGLDTRVDGWAISDAEGVRKPDARLFEVAARCCGTTPAGGWMVGDDPAKDIAGGAGAGLRTIWIDRGVTAAPPQADHTVGDVLQAIALLKQM